MINRFWAWWDAGGNDMLGYGLLFLLFLWASLTIAWDQFNELNELLVSRQWPTISGTVTSSEHGWRSTWYADGTEYTKVTTISYSYKVGDGQFTGEVSTEASIFVGKVDRLAEKYPEGSTITVYYDLENPERSIVEPGLNLCLFTIVFSLIILLILFLILRYVIKRRLAYIPYSRV